MKEYKNLGGQEEVESYEYDGSSITVKFKVKSDGGHDTYTYTYASAGPENVEEMKKLALAGEGLQGFIRANVRTKYESKA